LLARVRALLRHEREHHLDEARLGSELEMAAQVQQGLFPHVLPEAPGLDYAGICWPARGVSGDYYDFLALGGGRSDAVQPDRGLLAHQHRRTVPGISRWLAFARTSPQRSPAPRKLARTAECSDITLIVMKAL